MLCFEGVIVVVVVAVVATVEIRARLVDNFPFLVVFVVDGGQDIMIHSHYHGAEQDQGLDWRRLTPYDSRNPASAERLSPV